MASASGAEPHGTIITAHPQANGFYGSKGVSGMLPPAYTLMSKRFLDAVYTQGLQQRLGLHEWKRGTVGTAGGWSYHAKGLWVTLPQSQHGPSVTLIGSSNYTKRSHTLDLEANALVLTTDPGLQSRLREEEQHLMQYAGEKLTPREFEKEDRKVSWRVRVALWITNAIGGAL